MDGHLRSFGSLQPPDFASILSVVRTNATTFQVNFDRPTSLWSGGSWGIQIFRGGTWITATNLASVPPNAATFQIGGSDPAVGSPWRIEAVNTSILFAPATISVPASGLVI